MSFYGENFRPIRPRNVELVNRILGHIQNKEGFSVPMQGAPEPTTGYMVSLSGYETIFEDTPNWRGLALDILKKLTLADTKDYPLYIGGWYDNGHYYLDVSRNMSDYEEAMRFADENNQLAVYDIANDTCISCVPA